MAGLVVLGLCCYGIYAGWWSSLGSTANGSRGDRSPGKPLSTVDTPRANSAGARTASKAPKILVKFVGYRVGCSGEVFVYSENKLERRESFARLNELVLADLTPGIKVVHVLPADPETAPFTAAVEASSIEDRDLVVPEAPALTVRGQLVDVTDRPCSGLYVHSMQFPMEKPALVFEGRIDEAVVCQIDLREIYDTAPDGRRKSIRVVHPLAVILATSTDADGRFEIRGVYDRVIRIQVFDTTELLHDGFVVADMPPVKTVVRAGSSRVGTLRELQATVQGVRHSSLKGQLGRFLEGYPHSRTPVVTALERARDAELNPQRQRVLEEVLQFVSSGPRR